MGRSGKGNKVSNSAPRSLLLGESGGRFSAQASSTSNLTLEKIITSFKDIQKETLKDFQLSINTPPGSLSGKALQGEDLFGIDFSGYDFSLSELKQVNFGYKDKEVASKLNNASFKEANLNNVSFENVSLENANLKNSKLNFCHFKKTNLSGADITEGTFFGSEFVELDPGSLDCKFFGENIFNKVIINTCLKPFSQETNLEGVSFLGAEIDQTVFSVNQQFKNSIFFESTINGSSLQGADFEGANLAMSKVTDSDMQAAHFINADLSHTVVKNSNFYQADFKEADLSYLKAEESVFADANFDGADLSGAIFNDCHFARADLTKAKNRSKAKFINCTGLN